MKRDQRGPHDGEGPHYPQDIILLEPEKDGDLSAPYAWGKGQSTGTGGIDVGDSPRNEEFHQKMVSFRVIEALRYALVGLVSTLSRRRAVVSREVILRRR